MLEQAADEPQRRVRQLGVALLVIKQGLAVLPQPDVDVHAAARLAVERLGHEGGGLSGADGAVLDKVLGNHGLVGHFGEALGLHLYLQLARAAHLVVVVLHLDAPVGHFHADVVAQVEGHVLGQGGVVAVVVGSLIAQAVGVGGGPVCLGAVHPEGGSVGGVFKADPVKDIEFKLRAHHHRVGDAGFPHVFLCPLGDAAGVLAEPAVLRLVDDLYVPGHGQGWRGGEGLQAGGIQIWHENHVALLH